MFRYCHCVNVCLDQKNCPDKTTVTEELLKYKKIAFTVYKLKD